VPAVRHVFDVAALNVQLHGPGNGVARDMLRRGMRVQTAAKRRAPADSGRLRGSLTIATEPRNVLGISTFAVLIGTNLSYARWVHDGTGIYGPTGAPIVARGGTYLVFKSKTTGRLVFTRSVRGQEGVAFLKEALEAAR
jgi:hypothetical protein